MQIENLVMSTFCHSKKKRNGLKKICHDCLMSHDGRRTAKNRANKLELILSVNILAALLILLLNTTCSTAMSVRLVFRQLGYLKPQNLAFPRPFGGIPSL